jgi:phosphate starvation-inducible PhoH-like protein
MVTGDPVKSIYQEEPFGLKEALLVLKDIEGIGIVYLDDKDIVRHRLVLDAYKYTENQE